MMGTTSENSRYLGINPLVLFRPTFIVVESKTASVGLHVKNSVDQSQYEFSGRAAILWLSLDGSRTAEQAIKNCQKILKITDKKFSSEGRTFVNNLLELQLISESLSPTNDARSRDMKLFLKILTGKNKKTKIRVPKVKARPDDRKALNKIKSESFSNLLKNGFKLNIKRAAPPLYKGMFQLFSAQVSYPSRKERDTGNGAALTVEKAVLAAVGESLERTANVATDLDIPSSSYVQLRETAREALDPASLKFFHPDQIVMKNHEVSELSREAVGGWSYFEDSYSGRPVLIPGRLNDAAKENPAFICEVTSSGCAAGPNAERAKLSAVLELIERDNFLFYWRTKNSPAVIDFLNPNDRVKKLLQMAGDFKKRISLFYLKSDLGAVTVQAVLRGDHSRGEPYFLSASACRLNPVDAIEKALIELLYVKAGFDNTTGPRAYYGASFENSVWEFGDRTDLYGWYPVRQAYSFLFEKDRSTVHWSEIPNFDTGDTTGDLRALISDFHRQSIKLYFRDNTPKLLRESGFWVYRAFSPDLIAIEGSHRLSQLGHPRYFELSKKLKLKKIPTGPDQLSSWPHPLP